MMESAPLQDGEGAVGRKLGLQNGHDTFDNPAKAGHDNHHRGERRGREGLVAQDYGAAKIMSRLEMMLVTRQPVGSSGSKMAVNSLMAAVITK